MAWGPELKKILVQESRPDARESDVRIAAVLAAIGWNAEAGENQVVLMKRSTTEVGPHRGQISFPGGIREAGDLSSLETALRESFEEIGLAPPDAEVLGTLTPVLARGEVLIYPWVAKINLPYRFVLSTAEVDRLLFLPLSRLVNEGLTPVTVKAEAFSVKSEGIVLDGELVWGATARMLKELREAVAGLQYSLPI